MPATGQDDSAAQVGDDCSHGIHSPEAKGAVSLASEKERGLNDGRIRKHSELGCVSIHIPIPVERATKAGARECAGVVVEVGFPKPRWKWIWLWHAFENARVGRL